MESAVDPRTEAQIREWRSYLLRRRTIDQVDVDELEDHLRSQISELGTAGLSGDESFLVAIKRIGSVSELSREFALERSSRLWKQLVLAGDSVRERSGLGYVALLIMGCFAVGAALAFKLPTAFGIDPFGPDSSGEADAAFYLRNSSLLALPFLVGFLAWKRRLPINVVGWLAVPFAAAAILVNALPFDRGGDTEVLAAIHLPIAFWLVVGVAYLGGAWRPDAPRMDFVRFTGEWFIYYTLIAFGGVVLTALTLAVFEAIDIDMLPVITSWVVPCGAVAALAGMALTGNVIDAERDVLIVLDVLLVLVVGLVLYSISAREPDARPTLMDAVQLVLVVSALVIDVLALAAIVGRINEFGFTPNRTAGLGLNLVLLANLLWSSWLLVAFVRGRSPFTRLERWQTRYIPVYAAWAAIVVVAFPPLFGFD